MQQTQLQKGRNRHEHVCLASSSGGQQTRVDHLLVHEPVGPPCTVHLSEAFMKYSFMSETFTKDHFMKDSFNLRALGSSLELLLAKHCIKYSNLGGKYSIPCTISGTHPPKSTHAWRPHWMVSLFRLLVRCSLACALRCTVAVLIIEPLGSNILGEDA
jgi:hypothetical protein